MTIAAVHDARAGCGCSLPPELRALLLESNGVLDEYGDRAFAGRAQGLAAQERDEARASFFASVSRDLGLFPEAG